jgi:2-amino-4-hydroxy-6-hydroxymethyldihydropteridine diphosphokinase
VKGPQRRAVLALGTNEGDRLAHLQGGLDLLRATPELVVLAVSPVYETDPVGGPSQPDFLNAVVVAATTLDGPELLVRAHEVEAAHGRERREHWGPRTLDVDLITVGDEQRDGPDLTLPHPLARERAFVLLPWLAADPAAELPGVGAVAELVAALDTSGVRERRDMSLAAHQ